MAQLINVVGRFNARSFLTPADVLLKTMVLEIVTGGRSISVSKMPPEPKLPGLAEVEFPSIVQFSISTGPDGSDMIKPPTRVLLFPTIVQFRMTSLVGFRPAPPDPPPRSTLFAMVVSNTV